MKRGPSTPLDIGKLSHPENCLLFKTTAPSGHRPGTGTAQPRTAARAAADTTLPHRTSGRPRFMFADNLRTAQIPAHFLFISLCARVRVIECACVVLSVLDSQRGAYFPVEPHSASRGCKHSGEG